MVKRNFVLIYSTEQAGVAVMLQSCTGRMRGYNFGHTSQPHQHFSWIARVPQRKLQIHIMKSFPTCQMMDSIYQITSTNCNVQSPEPMGMEET